MNSAYPRSPSLVLLCALTMAGCGGTPGDPLDSAQVAQGKVVYQAQCARCHGADLSGQAQWRRRKPDGKLPAPPHDASGHTWHHPDDILFEIVKFGLRPPHAPAGYQSDMPAFQDSLSDKEIWAVLAYIKSTWPADIQQRQAASTAAQRR